MELTEKLWSELDGPSLCACAAALQLLPENIPYLVRLERLAAIGATLPSRPSAPCISPSKLRSVLKHPLVSGESVRSGEDQYDDVYIEEVPFHGGPRLVMQGLTSRSAHTARMLLNAIHGPAGESLPETYRREATGLTLALLDLSDVICSRAGLNRNLAPPDKRHGEVFVPGREGLDRLINAVTFTQEETRQIFSGRRDHLQALIVRPGERTLRFDEGTDDDLIVRPILLTPTGIVVASPAEIAASLRHWLILLAEEFGCVGKLATAFQATVAAMTHGVMILQRATMESSDWIECAGGVLLARFHHDDDLTTDVALISDDFAGYSTDLPFGTWPALAELWSHSHTGHAAQHRQQGQRPDRRPQPHRRH